ncbi:hypothetical protein BSNK01_23710 [Bacillaceae bacterium]
MRKGKKKFKLFWEGAHDDLTQTRFFPALENWQTSVIIEKQNKLSFLKERDGKFQSI